jgi:hypothetical protein
VPGSHLRPNRNGPAHAHGVGTTPGGAPTKRTPAVAKALCESIEAGLTYRLACACAGIGQTTFHDWRAADPEFSKALKEAEGRGAQRCIAKILAAADESWQAAAWILERRHPQDFGRQIVKHEGSLTVTSPLQEILARNAQAANEWPVPAATNGKHE